MHRRALTTVVLLPALALLAALVVLAAVERSHAPHAAHPAGWGHPPAGQHYPPQPGFTAVPSAVMYDTITLATVPPRPFALAGYTSGFWPTYLPLRRRYPAAHTVSIAINDQHRADCLDVEPGDATPGQVAGWVHREHEAGVARPCVYSSYWEFTGQIRPLLNAAHVKRSTVYEWDADYTYRPHIDTGFDATQWTDHALGRNLDESLVTREFLRIATPPLLPPRPKPRPHPARRHHARPHHPSRQLVHRWRLERRHALRILRTHCKAHPHRTACVRLRAREHRLYLDIRGAR